MDAWQNLIFGSTIISGDAWEHLLAQGGACTGTIDYIILADGLEAGMENETIAAELDQQSIAVNIDNTLVGVGVDDQEILVEVK